MALLPPCTCGGIVEVDQIDVDKWIVRCRDCSAIAVGDSEKSTKLRWEENATILTERNERALKFTNGEIHECCKDPHNLRYHSKRYDLTTYVCGVCEKKHYKVWAEPGRMGFVQFVGSVTNA